MTVTYKTICNLISTAMFGSAVSYDKDIDWADVFEEMKTHRIAGLVSEALPGLNMDADIKKEWRKYILRQRLFFDEITTAQNEICEAIKEIPYVIIKGTSSAMYYPIPNQRNMGDIDILFDGGVEETRDKLIKKGFVINSVGGYRHIALRKGRVHVELHYKYDNTIVNDIVNDAIKNAEEKVNGGCRFYSLPKLENGLILLSHLSGHLQEGVGFRQVIDWMMFVADGEVMDWESFNDISKEAGLYTFQCHITKMCVKYFGLPLKNEIMWCEEANDSTCEKLLELLARRGNFGIKEGGYAAQFAIKNKLVYGIKRLQLGGTFRWKALIKHPWLKPFAWVYQLGRVAREMATRKEPLEAIRKDLKEAEAFTKLMNELGLKVSDAREP